MDHTEAQLHQEIIHTRQVIDERLAQIERRGQETVHRFASTVTDAIHHSLMPSVQRVQDTSAKGDALLAQYPWLIVVSGALLGYLLGRPDGARRLPTELGRVRTYEVAPYCPPLTRF